jgi:2-dehydro-3-deoxyphosphogluconate aldolase / (4S)-4-hydroxy-2-oxoglutarate aldolase
MNKSEVISRLTETGVIPVIRAASADEASRAIDALKAGGIDVFEITMTVPGAIRLIEKLAASYAGEALIGAGTVLDAQIARECLSAGAQFIISPALNLDTILFCNQSETVVMPGALTPTEIVTAWNAGADFVKVFPAGALGGASYLKSLKAPLPHIKLIPTGGVSLRTAADFIKAGASAVGVGADLVDLEALRNGQEDLITEKAQKYLEIVRKARQKQ